MKISFNEWKVSGEVFYLKELSGEFAASAKIRGVAKRQDVYSSNILEITCLLQGKVYEKAKMKGLRQYCNATFSGHLESWIKDEKHKKIMFIADNIIEVEQGGKKK